MAYSNEVDNLICRPASNLLVGQRQQVVVLSLPRVAVGRLTWRDARAVREDPVEKGPAGRTWMASKSQAWIRSSGTCWHGPWVAVVHRRPVSWRTSCISAMCCVWMDVQGINQDAELSRHGGGNGSDGGVQARTSRADLFIAPSCGSSAQWNGFVQSIVDCCSGSSLALQSTAGCYT
jgi:hypothetical protein